MKKGLPLIILALVVILAAGPALAAAPSGELSLGVGYQWDEENKEAVHTSTTTGFRLVLEDGLETGGRLHFSTKGWWDWKARDGSIALDQLWLSGYYGDFDYKLGRQLISWGTADGFNPTNYFSRLDSAALLRGDLSGEPIWAGQGLYYGSNWSVTGVVIPRFKPQKIDELMAGLLLEADPQAALILQAIEGTEKPSGSESVEAALRVETQLGGFDLQASYFWGYEPLPALELVLGPTGMAMEGTYRRQHFFGLAAAGTVGEAGVWAELTYGGPVPFGEGTNPTELRIPLSINEPYLQAVLGADYTVGIGSGLLIQGQYIYRGQGSLLAPYTQPTETLEPGKIEAGRYLYSRLSYNFNFNSSAQLVLLHGVKEKGGIIRPSYTHSFPNGIQLELSLIQPYGEGDFASISPQAGLALKYQF